MKHPARVGCDGVVEYFAYEVELVGGRTAIMEEDEHEERKWRGTCISCAIPNEA